MTADEHHQIDQLVERAREGDVAAFGALYDHFAPRVYRFLRFRSGADADAEDLLQSVFVKMIEALPRYESRGLPFGAWVFRIVRNALIDHARTRRAHDPIDVAAAAAAAPERTDPANRVPDRIAVRDALARLTPDQRDVIGYRFFAGLTPPEIAKVMDRREGSVRALQFRALGALRRALASPPDVRP